MSYMACKNEFRENLIKDKFTNHSHVLHYRFVPINNIVECFCKSLLKKILMNWFLKSFEENKSTLRVLCHLFFVLCEIKPLQNYANTNYRPFELRVFL